MLLVETNRVKLEMNQIRLTKSVIFICLLAFKLASFGQASVSLTGALSDYKIDTSYQYLLGNPAAEYGKWFDGPMNPYRRGSYGNTQIKAFVPMSENYRYNIPSLNNPAGWTLDVSDRVESPRDATFANYDNRYWIFSTYSYDPDGLFVIGFCHEENYTATQIYPYPSPTRTLQKNGVNIPGFPNPAASPYSWSAYNHIWAGAFNLIYSGDGGNSFARGGSVISRSVLVPANPPTPGTVQPWYGFFHPSNPVYEAPYIYIFVQHISRICANFNWTGTGYTWDVTYAGPVLLRINAVDLVTSIYGGYYNRSMWQHYVTPNSTWENISPYVAQDASAIAGTQRVYPLFYSSGPINGSGLAKQGYIQNIRRVGNSWVTLGTDDTYGAGRLVWRATPGLGSYAWYLKYWGGDVDMNSVDGVNFFLGQQKYISFVDWSCPSTDHNFQTVPNNSESSYLVVANGTTASPHCSGWRRIAITFSGFP